jgi:hypothetical protein
MIEVKEAPTQDFCRGCGILSRVFEVRVHRPDEMQRMNRFWLCIHCLDELREATSKIILF